MRSPILITLLFILVALSAFAAEPSAPLVTAPHWKKSGIHFEATAREPFVADLAALVEAPERFPLTFKKITGPAWINVTPGGQLGGLPTDASVGSAPITIVAKNEGGTAQTEIALHVAAKNHPPIVDDGALRFNVKERETLRVQLARAPYAHDPDAGDTLSFALGGEKADWVKLAKNGELVATPAFAQIGEHVFALQVSDGNTTVTGTLQITVERSPRPPVWKKDGLAFELHSRQPFRQSLKELVSDADGIGLIFEKKSGPLWAKVSVDGQVSGSPQDGDIGTQRLIVTAKNDAAAADFPLTFKIVFTRRAPIFLKNNFVLPLAKLGEDFHYSAHNFAVDPDPPHVLAFSITSGPPWLKISGEGVLESTQPIPTMGRFPLVLRATNSSGLFAESHFELTVAKKNSPPKLVKSPVKIDPVKVGELMTVDLSPYVMDPDGDVLTFHEKKGPDWLNVAKTGQVTGVPEEIDLGPFEIDVEASDGRELVILVVQGSVEARSKRASAK